MSTLARVMLAVVEVLAAGALGALVGAWWVRRGEPVELLDEAEAAVETERSGRWWRPIFATQDAMVRALNAHMSLRARLVAVSDSALEHAQALERLQEAGLRPARCGQTPTGSPRQSSRATCHAQVRRRHGRRSTGPSTHCWRRSTNRGQAASGTPAPTHRSGAPPGRSPTDWPAHLHWRWRPGARSAPSAARTPAG